MSLLENKIDFNPLEREIFYPVCELGAKIIAAVLGEWYEELR